MMELLSVIVPNYNKQEFLSICLDSILKQTYPNIEIIIVDDCSQDSSQMIIREYEKKYSNIRAIFLEKNQGVSHARNLGIEYAAGTYVTMLDSDDFYYNPEKLEKEMSLLEKHQGEGVAYSYRIVVDEYGNPIYSERKNIERYVSGNVFYHFLTEKDAFGFVQRDYCLPKEYIKSVGGYHENESYYEDYDLLLRLSFRYPLYYTNCDGTAYRFMSSGLSVNKRENDGKQFRVPQMIRLRYMKKLKGRQRIQAYMIWCVESMKLEIRIMGRKVLSILRTREKKK